MKLFKSKQISTHWNAKNEKWYFSLEGVFSVLAERLGKSINIGKRKEF